MLGLQKQKNQFRITFEIQVIMHVIFKKYVY